MDHSKVIFPRSNVPQLQGAGHARQFLWNGCSVSMLKWIHLCQLFTPSGWLLLTYEDFMFFSPPSVLVAIYWAPPMHLILSQSHFISHSILWGRNHYTFSFNDMEFKSQRVWITDTSSHSQEEAKTKYLHRPAECRAGVLSF